MLLLGLSGMQKGGEKERVEGADVSVFISDSPKHIRFMRK